MAAPATMKAWQYSSVPGGLIPNLQLKPTATPPPPPPADRVLIEVISMALNPADYKVPVMLGGLFSKLITPKPASPGLDFSGRVVTPTADFNAGDLVFGRLDRPYQYGTLAQFIVAPREGVAPLPAGVDADDAAAIGTAALTAYQSLVPYVKAGDRVFVNGGSGGVGVFTIQIAKILGCEVVASCSGANAALCKELGADEAVDYRSVDVCEVLKARGAVFDHVVDNVGTPLELFMASDAFLKRGKQFVLVGASADSLLGIWTMLKNALLPTFLGGGSNKWKFILTANNLDQLVEIAQWVREEKIKVVLDSVFPYEDAPKAYEKLKTGRSRGKIVVHVTEKP